MHFCECVCVAREIGRSEQMVEKDTIQSMFLYELAKSELPFVFKGGTSLSKAYNLIDRFSEDIDLTLKIDSKSYGKRRKLKQSIIETCQELGFEIIRLKTGTPPRILKSSINFNRLLVNI